MITKKVFLDLSIFMVGFGVLIGVIFPFFSIAMGIPREYVLTPVFIVSCISAGIFVGLFSHFLAYKIVGNKIRILSEKMSHVTEIVADRNLGLSETDCDEASCYISVDSDDELGATAVAFNSLVQSLSNSYRTENSLKEFNKAISSRLELKELCDVALNHFVQYSNSDGGLVIVEQSGELKIVSSRGIKENDDFLNHDLVWRVLKTKVAETIQLPKDVIIDGLLLSYQPSEIVLLPIVYKDLSLGLIVIATTINYTKQVINDLNLFISSFSLALKNALSYGQLQKLAANDALTNVFNRRFGNVRLGEEFNRSVRMNLPLGVFMADLDFFKSVNDTYGHTVGDRVLIHFAQIAKQALREGDILVRYGGEEFLAILPGASGKDTRLVAERLRRMTQESVVYHLEQEIKITVSIGVTSYPENGASKIE